MVLRNLPQFECSAEQLEGARVFLDADGTLMKGLKSGRSDQLESIRDLFKGMIDAGVESVSFATGRPLWATLLMRDNCLSGDDEVMRFLGKSSHVLHDGAMITDGWNVVPELSVFFEEIWVETLLRMTKDRNVEIGFDTERHYFVSEDPVYTDHYFGVEFQRPVSERVFDERVYSAYCVKFSEKKEAEGFAMGIRDMTEGLLEGHYFRSFEGDHCLVVTPFGVNKMTGIESACDVMGGPGTSIFFSGDSSNDVPVFRYANSTENRLNVTAIPSPHTKPDSPILQFSNYGIPYRNLRGTFGLR